MSKRFANVDWDEVANATRQAIQESVYETDGLRPNASPVSVQRSTGVKAVVKAIDLSQSGVTVRFGLAPDEDLDAWSSEGNEPFATLKIGGIPFVGARLVEPPVTETNESGGWEWALVIQCNDPVACAALQSMMTLSSPVSIDGVLKRGGRSVFGSWKPASTQG